MFAPAIICVTPPFEAYDADVAKEALVAVAAFPVIEALIAEALIHFACVVL